MKAVASQLRGQIGRLAMSYFFFSVAMIKHHDKSDLREKRAILVHSSKVQFTRPKEQEPEASVHIMPPSGSREQ